MCTYKIYTHDQNGKTKIMYCMYNVTIKEIIEYIKKEMFGKLHGESFVCKLNNITGREGKKHKIF